MKKELSLVKEFHEKFKIPILDKPTLIPKDRSDLRLVLMKDEVMEYKRGVETDDLQNIAKELADVLYSTYGTILEHGLQYIMDDVFAEVHKSNMSKEYHQYKILKGADYKKADLGEIFKDY